jgi:DNA-binding IclR family transcriptional regulator
VPPSARDARRALILAVLDEEPALTQAELVDRTQLPSRLLARTLWAMEEEGMVAREGRRWFPPAAPKL